MQYKFDKKIEHIGIEDYSTVLVAVSGGIDSMALLSLLHNSKLNLDLYVAHVNFSLRADESDRDEALVREWCAEHKIELFVQRFNTKEFAQANSLSLEMAARKLRYDWFYSLMQEHKFSYLAIAHNANDNAETLYLNLLRTTGLDGICAIKEKVDIVLNSCNFKIVRPLLDYTRKEIEHHVNNCAIPFRVDSTNLENNFSRNKIRNIVIPYFEQINPSAIKSVNKSIKYFSIANSILHKMQDEIEKKVCLPLEDFSTLNPSFKFLEKVINIPAITSEIGFEYWLFCLLSNFGFNSTIIEDIAANLSSVETKRYLSGSKVLIKERSLLKIYSNEILLNLDDIVIESLEELYSNSNKTFAFGNMMLSFQIIDFKNDEQRSEFIGTMKKENKCGDESSFKNLYLDYSKLTFPLRIRSFKNGDKFNPFGMMGAKKISDFFTDIKIDNANRALIPLMAIVKEGRDIACVAGYRIDKKYSIDTKSKGYLSVRCWV